MVSARRSARMSSPCSTTVSPTSRKGRRSSPRRRATPRAPRGWPTSQMASLMPSSSPPRSAPANASTSSRDGNPAPGGLDGFGRLASPIAMEEASARAEIPGNREEAGVGHHPMVRTYGGAVDVPAAVEALDGAGVDPPALQCFPRLRRLDDARRVGQEDSASEQDALGVGDDAPRLGEVEDDAIERAVVDALVAVAQLHAVAIEHRSAEEAADVGTGPVGEVLAELVADDVGTPPEHGHRQRPRAHAGLEHTLTGPDVSEHADRRQVLGIDDLSAARHLDDEVLE